ncbi:response regulator [Bradyrhizobium sp. DOA1]|uniref:response regulator n=1 Tax=Bradyrhizobium sp. DOA1 TaxID=1126616 RepID=UPI00077C3282|nr:response regulator [Bradyrhizobium sp. DOA1]KYH01911.1 hypothetical protein SE91_28740 [Bradyrhizobium sp. DOA1]
MMLRTVSSPDTKHPVLVVDDEPMIRMMMADELRALGLKVIECGTADEALDVLSSGTSVSLVFTDVRMPGTLDGIGLAHAVKRGFPELKVILTSAQQIPPGTGCDGFFAKPWDMPHVMRHLKAILSA